MDLEILYNNPSKEKKMAKKSISKKKNPKTIYKKDMAVAKAAFNNDKKKIKSLSKKPTHVVGKVITPTEKKFNNEIARISAKIEKVKAAGKTPANIKTMEHYKRLLNKLTDKAVQTQQRLKKENERFRQKGYVPSDLSEKQGKAEIAKEARNKKKQIERDKKELAQAKRSLKANYSMFNETIFKDKKKPSKKKPTKKKAAKKKPAKKVAKKVTKKVAKKTTKKVAKKTTRRVRVKRNPIITLANPSKTKKKVAKKTAKKVSKKKTSKKRKSSKKATKKKTVLDLMQPEMKVTKKSKRKVLKKKKTSKKVAKKRKAKKSYMAKALKGPMVAKSKKSYKKKKYKVKTNPGVVMDKLGKITKDYLAHDLAEAGGLIAGGAAIKGVEHLRKKFLPQISSTLASIPFVGAFLEKNVDTIIPLALGVIGHRFVNNDKVQALAKGMIGASVVNIGASLYIQAAKMAGAEMSGIIAVPEMNGIIAVPEMGAMKMVGDFQGIGSTDISSADFGATRGVGLNGGYMQDADFGSDEPSVSMARQPGELNGYEDVEYSDESEF